MEKFIKLFKEQLEDVDTNLLPTTNFTLEEFWDSLTAVTIQMMIADEYNVNIEIKDFINFKSIQELYDFVISQ